MPVREHGITAGKWGGRIFGITISAFTLGAMLTVAVIAAALVSRLINVNIHDSYTVSGEASQTVDLYRGEQQDIEYVLTNVSGETARFTPLFNIPDEMSCTVSPEFADLGPGDNVTFVFTLDAGTMPAGSTSFVIDFSKD